MQEGWSIIKRVFIVMLWIVMALGLYQCGTHLDGSDARQAQKTEEADASGQTDAAEEDEGEVQAALPFDKIARILIMDSGYQGIYHSELCISGSGGMTVEVNGNISEFAPGSEYVLRADALQTGDVVTLRNRDDGRLLIQNIGRNSPPRYRGILMCYSEAEGIVVVNELPVEEYLLGVVPSEMPSSYPVEALKAQAVSARTYAYFHKQGYAYPEWQAHMDDSTAFQVYMNFEETPEASRAVEETRDMVLAYENEIVESFYYSTSGGFNGGAGVWKDNVTAADGYLTETGEEIFASNSEEGEAAYREFIDNGNADDVEYGEAWYRWDYDKELDSSAVRNMLDKLYELSASQPQAVRISSRYLPAYKIKEEDGIRDVRILNRRKSGLVTGIIIETEHFRVSVRTQHAVRQALGYAGAAVRKKDGSVYTMGDILPSAYFYMEKSYDKNGEKGDTLKKISLHGAGLGHGCGMSQNGAKCLADRGLTAGEILAYYYHGDIKAVDELGMAAD